MLAALLSFATLLPAGAIAQASSSFSPFHLDPMRSETLRLDGEINVRTPFMLGAALREYPDVTTLELHSPGGDVYQALAMVDLIRAAGLSTHIAPDDRCYSACSFLFFAGTKRTADGELGVHQLLAPNQQSAQFVMNDVLDALAVLDVPDEVRRRMFQTPPDQMYVFFPDELVALGLVRQAKVPDAPWAEVAERDSGSSDVASPAQVDFSAIRNEIEGIAIETKVPVNVLLAQIERAGLKYNPVAVARYAAAQIKSKMDQGLDAEAATRAFLGDWGGADDFLERAREIGYELYPVAHD